MKTPILTDLEEMCRLGLALFVAKNKQVLLPLLLKASSLEIAAIVAKNLQAGRLVRQNRLRAPSPQLTLETYINRVIALWSLERPVWVGLRALDAATWQWLEQDLLQAARGMLVKRARAGSEASTIEDYVQRTFYQVLRFDYPFDIPLRVWMHTILKNTIREPDRSRDALDRWHFSLDVPFVSNSASGVQSTVQEYSDDTAEHVLGQIREREAILQYFTKLTPLRQAVLALTFFDGVPDPEIAKKLEITMSHLYSTRHRALKQLSRLMVDRSMQGQLSPLELKN